MTVTRRVGASVVAFVVASVGAVTTIALGPSKLIVCGAGSGLDAVADDIGQRFGGGHVDGPSASYCTVPSMSAWLLGGLAFVGITAIVIALFVRSPRSAEV